ncbi:MAG TPA: hypothetical protein VMZ27_07060, partial [Candidatus Saccharimonadales bacterium]|nr:hypothetical protein [Candidatus Saccharimonadales bacterium]
MSRVFLVLSMFAFWTSSLRAQITVDLALDQEQFLRDESVPLKIEVSNRSGQKIWLGKDPEWVTFSVENLDGSSVSRLDDVKLPGELALESAMAGARTVDLNSFFDVTKPGRYAITATVRVKEWDKEFSSKRKTFDVVRGSKIWEQEFGVPGAGVPEVRKYVLQQANYLKRLVLYVRISDASDNQVLRVFPLGPLVSFSRPETQIDKESKLHVLFQTGAHSFLYNVIAPGGQVTDRQTYEYTASRPVL